MSYYSDQNSKTAVISFMLVSYVYFLHDIFIVMNNLYQSHEYLKLFNRILVVNKTMHTHLFYRPSIAHILFEVKTRQLLVVVLYVGLNTLTVVIRGILFNTWDLLKFSIAYSIVMVTCNMYYILSLTVATVIGNKFSFLNQLIANSTSSACSHCSKVELCEILTTSFRCLDQLYDILTLYYNSFGICYMVSTLTVFCETTLQAFFLCDRLMMPEIVNNSNMNNTLYHAFDAVWTICQWITFVYMVAEFNNLKKKVCI